MADTANPRRHPLIRRVVRPVSDADRAGAGESSILGQSILFDNQGGASGAIGAEHVKNTVPTATRSSMTTTAMVCIAQHLQALPFTSCTRCTTSFRWQAARHVLDRHAGDSGSAQVPSNNLQEFITYAKANPGKINFGSAGLATITQLYGEIFNIEAGVKMVHVPTREARRATNDLLSGQIQVQFDPTTLPHIAAGRLKCFAIASEEALAGPSSISRP